MRNMNVTYEGLREMPVYERRKYLGLYVEEMERLAKARQKA